ncbi:MAG TPA: GAF and ANTAR domain-containing protein [Mycobacteriales bacterium]|jgi:GAF domain-containing protein|nr:GAF and ANTAR domain-containing protein [Mycobacteriales bacterium]
MPQFRQLAELFTGLGAQIGGLVNVEDALTIVTRTSVEAIDAATSAGVTLRRNGRFETVAATDDLSVQVDRIQYELGSGPCVDAVVEDTVFRSDDLRSDPRWPQFGRRAVAETQVRSMMSFRMYFEGNDTLAGLNVYATRKGAFDDHAETTGLVLATHGALALTSALQLERIENLERALLTNRDIGVAIGIVMARHFTTKEQAFDLLRIASQRAHRKLADIAHDVIEQGDVPISGLGPPTTRESPRILQSGTADAPMTAPQRLAGRSSEPTVS